VSFLNLRQVDNGDAVQREMSDSLGEEGESRSVGIDDAVLDGELLETATPQRNAGYDGLRQRDFRLLPLLGPRDGVVAEDG